MKKSGILVLAFLLSLTFAYAQVSFGLKAGVNIAKQSFSGGGINLNSDNVVGMNAGAYLHIHLGKIGIQPEVYYSMVGSKFNLGNAQSTVKAGYVSVPLLVRFNITSFFNIHAGPQFGLLLNADETVAGTTSSIKSQWKSNDFSGVLGAGFDLPFGLNGGVRYVAGMSNIDNSGNGGTARNNVIQAYVGFRLFGK